MRDNLRTDRLPIRGFVFCTCLLIVLTGILPRTASAQIVDRRIAEVSGYADTMIRRLDTLRREQMSFETGTDRKGAVVGYREWGSLKCLTATIGLAGRDKVTRYVFRGGRVVTIDEFTVPFDPLKNVPHPEKSVLNARYLLISVGTRYVNGKDIKTYRPVTPEERTLIDDLMANLPHYRALLSGKRTTSSSR